jgi:hypothetical protein
MLMRNAAVHSDTGCYVLAYEREQCTCVRLNKRENVAIFVSAILSIRPSGMMPSTSYNLRHNKHKFRRTKDGSD